MSQFDIKNFTEDLKYDFSSSIVVFLVALPLCLGIALASGAPLFSGIIAGIVGGIVVSLISGSPLGVSGPAAGLAVIVLGALQEIGSFEIFLYAVFVAGIIQILLGVLRAGIIGYYFPSSVIKGMLSGIGIIIILKQIPHAFGYDQDPEGDFSFKQMDGHNTFSELGYMLDHLSTGAIIIAMVSLAILILWEQPFMKKMTLFKAIQGPLVVVALGIFMNLLFIDMAGLSLQDDQTVSIPVAGTLMGFFGQFTLPDFSQWANPQIYITALTIAVVASIETLLCVEATDKLDPKKRITPTNRELVAQGTGNMISGLIGGLPITQVIVRSSANIQSGGRTKKAAFIHGILLLISAMAIPRVLNLIPLASLAAILLVVGYKLAKPAIFKEMFEKGKSEFIPYVATILGIVFIDLLLGIAIGMIIGIFQILWNNYKRPYHFDPESYVPGNPILISLSEDVSFLNKASILRTLTLIPENSHVIIDTRPALSIHPDVLEICEDFKNNANVKNIQVEIIQKDRSNEQDPLKKFDHLVLNKPLKRKRPDLFG